MTPMHHYLYCKSDIILSKIDGFTVFSVQMSVCQPCVLWVMSSVFVAHLGAFGWHNIFVIKLLQSDVFISIDQHIIINQCYALHIFSNIVFRATWPLTNLWICFSQTGWFSKWFSILITLPVNILNIAGRFKPEQETAGAMFGHLPKFQPEPKSSTSSLYYFVT